MTTDRLDMKSIDFVSKNIESIAELFPNCITETSEGKRIDFTLLQQELSGDIVDGAKERYRLEWAGKREAIVNANLRTTNTLRPIREDSVDFDKTENIYIEGDNLEVLKILQESYLNKIKMIYIDPPYNTGNDFIYKDDFKKSVDELNLEEGNIDEQRNRLVANSNSSGRYHSDWLSMMYPRLKLARNLLTEDGVIFISIDDNEVHNLRKICDEIFGEMNFVSQIVWRKKTGSSDAKGFSIISEFILVYIKRNQYVSSSFNKDKEAHDVKRYNLSDEYVDRRGKHYIDNLDRGGIHYSDSMNYPITCPDGSITYPNGRKKMTREGWTWTWGKDKFEWGLKNGFIEFKKTNSKESGWGVYYKNYLYVNNKDEKTERSSPYKNMIMDILNTEATSEIDSLFNSKIFQYPKPSLLIKKLISFVNLQNDIILDFFSGSSSTAHAVMQLNAEDNLNRKFIMVQIPELCSEDTKAYEAGYKNICEIGKERIRRAGKKIIEEQRLVLESKKAELNKKMNGQMSLGNEKELEIEELRQEIIGIEKKIKRLDCGFRVFRLDSSNMKDVYYMPKDYKQEKLELFATNIKEDRETEDLIAQVMLDWGLELSKRIEKVEVAGKEVYKIENNALYCCFDEEIDEKFIRELAKQETHPLRIVFKDSSFKDDTAKENVAQLIKQLCPETEIKVI